MEKEMSVKDKLEQIKKDITIPVKLSDNEKDQIKRAFQAIREMLEDSEKTVMEMDRDGAYRYVNLIISGLSKADLDFIGGVKPKENLTDPKQKTGPASRPNYEELLGQLEPEERKKAEFLECSTSFREAGIDAICPECTLEKMKTCIKTFDPSIKLQAINNPEEGPSRQI